jgi:hypothetical protein
MVDTHSTPEEFEATRRMNRDLLTKLGTSPKKELTEDLFKPRQTPVVHLMEPEPSPGPRATQMKAWTRDSCSDTDSYNAPPSTPSQIVAAIPPPGPPPASQPPPPLPRRAATPVAPTGVGAANRKGNVSTGATPPPLSAGGALHPPRIPRSSGC